MFQLKKYMKNLKLIGLLMLLISGSNQSFAHSPSCLPETDSDKEKSELRISAPSESADTTANKTAYRALDFSKASRKAIVSWDSLENFVKDNPSSVSWASEECCPECGERIVLIHYSSPEDSWRNLAGREGILSVCPNCMIQIEFFLLKMN